MTTKNVGIDAAKKICEKHPSITYVAPPTGDWNDHFILHGLEDTRNRLFDEPVSMTMEDAQAEAGNRGLALDPSLWNGVDLLSLGMQAAEELSGVVIPQYNFPTILTHVANAIAGKISYAGVHPSFFFIRIGETSTNKTDTDQKVRNSVSPLFTQMNAKKQIESTFYGPNKFASGPGLMRFVMGQPRCLIIMDEITFLFTGRNKPTPNEASKTEAILELSTACEAPINTVYADTGNNININGAVINLTGNATEAVYDAFTLGDMASGLMQRFDFFAFDGEQPYYQEIFDSSDASVEFATRLKSLHSIEKPKGSYSLTDEMAPVKLKATPEVKTRLAEMSIANVDARRAETKGGGIKGLISRSYASTIKFALVHLAATRQGNAIFDPVELVDIEWGAKMANLLLEWKLRIFVPSISAGDFDSLVKLFIDGAKTVLKMGHPPTQKMICNRKVKLKNLSQKQWDEVVKSAVAHGLIRVQESGRKTVYELLKQ